VPVGLRAELPVTVQAQLEARLDARGISMSSSAAITTTPTARRVCPMSRAPSPSMGSAMPLLGSAVARRSKRNTACRCTALRLMVRPRSLIPLTAGSTTARKPRAHCPSSSLPCWSVIGWWRLRARPISRR
jgi:hypothetical protein